MGKGTKPRAKVVQVRDDALLRRHGDDDDGVEGTKTTATSHRYARGVVLGGHATRETIARGYADDGRGGGCLSFFVSNRRASS